MTRRFFLAVILTLACTAVANAQLTPDKALAALRLSDGLDVSLWASEPMFANPTCMDIDHKGRIWIVESINYRHTVRKQQPRRPAGDRILVLEDTKGTGKADKVTVFYQAPDVLAPLGICVVPYPDGIGSKVFVCQSPNIWVFEDKDGDGKADGPPKVFLTGFKGVDHDHGVHGLYVGPDNKFYFSVGDQGVNKLQSSDGKGRSWTSNQTDCRAGTNWRCDLDGKNLELIAHNFRNQYEPCMDSFGTMFVSDNDDDGNDQTRICYVMPGGNYGFHPRGKGQTHWHEEQPGVVPKILRTFRGSPTGMTVYEGTLLPQKYWGQPIHTDATPGRLCCYHLTPDGASFKVDREDIVRSKDNWFRPSDVTVAPDGSVFICDWYDPGVGGHGIRDFDRGRIYRITPKGHKGYKVPALDLTTEKGIRAALGSPNLAVRAASMAKIKNLLASRNDTDKQLARAVLVAPAIRQVYDNGKGANDYENVVLRARALWHIMATPGATFKDLDAAWDQKDDRFRVLGHRIVQDQRANEWETMAQKAIKDPSPAVRREALVNLRNQNATKAKPYLFELARQYDGKDRFYLAAVGIAAGNTDQMRRDFMLNDIEKQLPQWNEKTAGLLWELRPPGLIPRLALAVNDAKIPAGQRGLFADILATSPDLAAGTALVKALGQPLPADLRERILEGLTKQSAANWNNLRKTNELQAALKNLKGQKETYADALALLTTAKVEDSAWVAAVLADAKQSAGVRLAAVRALGAMNSDNSRKQLALLLDSSPAPSEELAVEAIILLGRQDLESARIKDLALNKRKPLAWRQAAVAALTANVANSNWLLQAHADKKFADDLTPDLARLLRNSPYKDVRTKAQNDLPAPPQMDPKNLPSIPALLARKGSIERGKEVLTASLKNNAQCLKCHTVQGVGGNVGPDLSSIGDKASRENLLESIIYPSRAISHQYETWVVTTKGGLLVTGLLVEESGDSLVFRDVNAKDYKFARKDIDSQVKSTVSIMPDNLILQMTENDLLDMVEYLYSLKGPVFTPPKK